jgi:hypothetical protein
MISWYEAFFRLICYVHTATDNRIMTALLYFLLFIIFKFKCHLSIESFLLLKITSKRKLDELKLV